MSTEVKTLAERVAALGHELGIGYFVYASGVVSKSKDAGKSPIVGVIVSKNPDKNARVGTRAKMLTLQQVRKPWASEEKLLGVSNVIYGDISTKNVIEKAEQIGIEVPACSYCAQFSCEGIAAGEAYLPSKQELEAASRSCDIVNEALEAINAPRFRGIYQTSSEYNRERVWQVCVEKSEAQIYAKTYGGDYTRAMVSL